MLWGVWCACGGSQGLCPRMRSVGVLFYFFSFFDASLELQRLVKTLIRARKAKNFVEA